MPKQESQSNAVSNRRQSGAYRDSAPHRRRTRRDSAQYPTKHKAPGHGHRSKVADILLTPLLK